MLTVLVFNDAANGVVETATYCRPNDPQRPGTIGIFALGSQVTICDEDTSLGAGSRDEGGTFTAGGVEDALPSDWYVRIMFDELLNADTAETLKPVLDEDGVETGVAVGSLEDTQPVTLTCDGVAVPYDGYYSPSGNRVTWPLGPSLFVAPLDSSTVPTGAECSISLNDQVKDKNGNAVPSDQRGPFTFTIGALEQTASDPEPAMPGDEATIDPDAPLLVTFNHFVDPASLTPAEVSILEVTDCAQTTGIARDAVIAGAEDDPHSLAITSTPTVPANLAWTPEKFYLVTFVDGAEVSDLAGGTADVGGFSVCFETDAAS